MEARERSGTRSGATTAVLSIAALLACGGTEQAQPARTAPREIIYRAACDGSAAVAALPYLVGGNDEDNVLRAYNLRSGGMPHAQYNLSTFLGVTSEADIEAAARVGDHVFWITSHARSKDGERKADRLRFFATKLKSSDDGITFTPLGRAYRDLLDDLLRLGRAGNLPLEGAAKKAPDEGGLNIEGMTAAPDGSLLLAFRSPLIGKRQEALVIPLLNPAEVVERAGAPRFGSIVTLDLGGRGVRSIDYSIRHRQYLIAAGASTEAGNFALFRWAGPGRQPSAIASPDLLRDFVPEAAVTDIDEAGRFLLLSDDGTVRIDGSECKSKKVPAEKRQFRGRFGTF